MLIPTLRVSVLVKRATTVEVGTDPADQLAVLSQAPPFPPCHVFVVWALISCAPKNASVATRAASSRLVRRGEGFVFMGSVELAGFGDRRWELEDGESWRTSDFRGRMSAEGRSTLRAEILGEVEFVRSVTWVCGRS